MTDAVMEETPVKARKEKKTGKVQPAEHDTAPNDLGLVVTRLDDAIAKDEKKKKRRKSEVAPVEESEPVVEEVVAERSPEKRKKGKSEAAAPVVDAVQDAVSTVFMTANILLTIADPDAGERKEKTQE